MEIIDKNWLLLDTCSTVSVCCNPNLVKDITSCSTSDALTIITNGGSQTFKQTATLNLLPLDVHYNPDSLANILSLSDVANLAGARITMDSKVERTINLHYNGRTLKFKECSDGLYFLDTTKTEDNYSNTQIIAYNTSSPHSHTYSSMLQTVNSNREFFTKREIAAADKA